MKWKESSIKNFFRLNCTQIKCIDRLWLVNKLSSKTNQSRNENVYEKSELPSQCKFGHHNLGISFVMPWKNDLFLQNERSAQTRIFSFLICTHTRIARFHPPMSIWLTDTTAFYTRTPRLCLLWLVVCFDFFFDFLHQFGNQNWSLGRLWSNFVYHSRWHPSERSPLTSMDNLSSFWKKNLLVSPESMLSR